MTAFPNGSFFALDFMSTSLESFSVAESVTANNLANVGTPGATRQQVDFVEGPQVPGSPANTVGGPTLGEGVSISQVQRITSNTYNALFRGASSSQNYYQTEQTTLQAVQNTLADPNSGVSAQYTAFQKAIAGLVSQSGSSSSSDTVQNVLSQAQALTTSLNTDANAITQQKASVMQQGTTLVQTVNGILNQIAALNGQIRSSTAAGDDPNSFSDQRDYLIDQLSQYISTQTSVQPDGSTLVTVNGQALVNDTTVYQLAAPTLGVGANGSPTFKINFATTPPASPNAPGIPLGSGQLSALADLYNNKLTSYGNQLNQYATSLATEVNRITEAGYTPSGAAGGPLFTPINSAYPISASNITVGITNPSLFALSLVSTQNGNLTKPMNSANNTVGTSDTIDGDGNLANPPAADAAGPPVTGGTSGALTITVDGQTQTFNYQTNALQPGANSTTIAKFISSFNAGGYGVTASFDSSSQRIVFQRDPSNESAALRAAQGSSAETPSFTITDTPASGAGILSALGAGGISGVTQGANNAFAASDDSGANALTTMFSQNVGIPALQTTSAAAATAGTAITIALPASTNNIAVGQVLTIDAQPGGGPPQENVTVTGTSFNPLTGAESITFTPQYNHAANFSVASAQTQTLQQYYGNFITQVGMDTQTANTGVTTQTTLANNINQTRQSISGINSDEETQNLIKYQSAYQAAAKTISTLNQMLSTVITSLGQ